MYGTRANPASVIKECFTLDLSQVDEGMEMIAEALNQTQPQWKDAKLDWSHLCVH